MAGIGKSWKESPAMALSARELTGRSWTLQKQPSLDAKMSHTIEAIVDRIVLKDGIAPRLRESVELACRESDGTCIISQESDGRWIEKLFSTRFSCPDCDLNFATPEPRSFSFNSSWGACPECSGFGVQGAVECGSGNRNISSDHPARRVSGHGYSRFRLP